MKTISLIGLALALAALAARPAPAQTLEAAGLSVGINSQLSDFSPTFSQRGASGGGTTFYEVESPKGGGFRLGLYGRWKLGEGGWFVQPEAALSRFTTFDYTVTEELPGNLGPTISVVGGSVRQSRLDAAVLGGYRLGKVHLLAGPVLAYALHRGRADGTTSSAGAQALVRALVARPVRVQVLAQAGLGLTLGRFALDARYERSLTPVVREIRLNNQTSAYRQTGQQALLTLGVDLYRPSGN